MYLSNITSIFNLPPPVSRAKKRFSLHFPVSITYLIPGIVIDVSAMLVANIHFRVSDGVVEKIFACCPGGRAAYIGQISTYKMGVRRKKARFD
jgi:hypothetical protein